MENTEPRRCRYCGEILTKSDPNWCDVVCLEMWCSLKQAEAIAKAMDTILDEHFGVKNANTRPS